MISLEKKKAFVFRFKSHFELISKHDWYPGLKASPVKHQIKYIAKMARIQLGYSKKTTDIDITFLLEKVFNKMDMTINTINDIEVLNHYICNKCGQIILAPEHDMPLICLNNYGICGNFHIYNPITWLITG